jgi:hypothetical protein
VLGRNPLLRVSDRVEALVIVFAIISSLVAAPVAGAVGTAVYAGRHQLYVGEAQTRHQATATVTGDAGWSGVVVENPAKAAEKSGFWVDSDGNQVDPPTPAWHAAVDGIRAGAAILLIVVAAAATLVIVAHSRLGQMRDAQWERELRCLADDDGGRNDRSYG